MGLSKSQRLGIVSAFQKAGIKLRATESIPLMRQGNGLEIDEYKIPSRIGKKQREDLIRLLDTQVGTLPPSRTEVVVQCGKH